MSQILTVIIDVDSDRGIAVNWFESDGLTDKLALAAVQAVEREMQRRAIRAELEAECATQPESEQTDGPA
ncbi:MAG TPA: hypothetical protein VM537_02720 [Anaerolineae bacterium]|nr:hypothetical protein [Anaerolineae bacterium]